MSHIPDIPGPLEKALMDKDVVVFVGAGVSKSVINKQTGKPLFPSWKGFVRILAKALRGEGKIVDANFLESSMEVDPPKYLDAIQHAKESLGDDNWQSFVKEIFDRNIDDADKDSLKLSKLIWKLGGDLIVTTNIDRVLQWTCPNPANFEALDGQKTGYREILKKTLKHQTVWHLHGRVSDPIHVIFTKEQFEAFYRRRNDETKLQSLLTLLATRTFIFIGFSLDDLYFREQLDYIHDIYLGTNSFYIVIPEKDRGKVKVPDYVSTIFYENYGPPLENLVEKMAKIESRKEKFKKGLSGYWEYHCMVNPGLTFDGKEVERGGVMEIKVIDDPHDYSLDATIDAKRMWSKEVNGTENILGKPIEWKSGGNAKITRDGIFEFQYTFTDAATGGTTTDTYVMKDNFLIESGTFVQLTKSPTGKVKKIKGKVVTRPMANETDLIWMPTEV